MFVNHVKRGKAYGRSTRSITFVTAALLLVTPFSFANGPSPEELSIDLIVKILLALATILIVNAIIPIVKAWLNKRALRKTFRSYLNAHVANTIESFGGAGSTHFAENHLEAEGESDWFKYLKEHNLGIPRIFLDFQIVLKRALDEENYIPSISYFGLDGNALDHTNPIWEMNGPESAAALKYFITQNQIESSIDYQYSDWFFELITSSEKTDRERWCRALENVLFDMAQHYHAALNLKKILDTLSKK